jgi:hypothetical protein
MDKAEVIHRLKDHLKGRLDKTNKITKVDKNYCINYIMDFLFLDRKSAKKILENEVLI